MSDNISISIAWAGENKEWITNIVSIGCVDGIREVIEEELEDEKKSMTFLLERYWKTVRYQFEPTEYYENRICYRMARVMWLEELIGALGGEQ